jgi:hypothetical protein
VLETDKAWLAGIIDGEGCISAFLNKETGGIIGCLNVLMTHKPTIYRIFKIVGDGFIYKQPPAKRGYKQLWGWRITSNRAANLLAQIAKYMTTKRKQARMYIKMMALYDGKKNRIASRVNHAERLSLMNAIREDKAVEFRE